MWERAAGRKSNLWIIVLLLATLLTVTPKLQIPGQLISFATLIPAVFLLTDWNDSAARKGVLALTARGEGRNKVRTAEWCFPALTGALLASVSVFTVSAPPPWQFWVTSWLIATSLSLLVLMTEQHFKNPGRVTLSLIWLVRLTVSQNDKVANFLLFTGYPAAVLTADPASGTPHPDSFVMASLVVVFLTAAGYAFLQKRNP